MTRPGVPTRGPLPGSGTRAGVQLLRFAVDDGAAALVRHVWVPLWSLPPGERVVQELLQYPGGNVVVMADEAGFYGVDTGLGTRALEGTGWGVGVMLRPAAAALLLRHQPADAARVGAARLDVGTAIRAERTELGADFTAACARVRELMPVEPEAAGRLLTDWVVAQCGPVDAEGELANAAADLAEQGSAGTVTELAERVGVGERQLQRICRRRIGLSPKWLLQRRRLQDAAARLGEVGPPALADLATELGYADQAHFTRDFTTVLGRPPGRFAREHHPRTSAVSKPAPTTHPHP